MKVLLVASEESSGVQLYKVSGGGKSCEVLASAQNLSCELTDLSPGTQVTVQAVACLANGDCSKAKSSFGLTLPDGNMSFLSSCNLIWQLCYFAFLRYSSKGYCLYRKA